MPLNTRVTGARNTGVFLGKCVWTAAKTMVMDRKKKTKTEGTSSTMFFLATATRTSVLLNIIKLFLTFVVFDKTRVTMRFSRQKCGIPHRVISSVCYLILVTCGADRGCTNERMVTCHYHNFLT